MPNEKDPALKTTMRPIGTAEPEEKATVTDKDDEENTSDSPQSEEDEAESPESDEDDAEGAEDEDTEGADDDAPVDELEFYVEGEGDAEPAEPKDVRGFAKLRKTVRDQQLKIAELERERQARLQPAGIPDPGPEPTEEDDDVNYDTAKLKAKYAKWLEDTKARKAWEAEQVQKAEAEQQTVRQIMDSYATTKAEFSKRVRGYDEAEEAFKRMFSDLHQDALFRNCDNPAKVIYLLHQRGDLERLSKETNRDKLVKELVKLEVTVKERKKGTPPRPERRIHGSGTTVQGDDPELARLRKKAEKDGNLGPVNARLRELRRLKEQQSRNK